jgi:hypothetical protein
MSLAALTQEPRWTATAGVRAGALDGAGALTDVFDVEIGPDGEMLAGQPGVGMIAVFAADGGYLRSIGRRGQGPGEFQVVGRMGWMRDTLWVVDFGRLQLFDSNLEFARSITFPTLRPPAGIRRVIPGPILADGSILGIPVMADDGRAAPIVLLSSAGEITDTLAHVLTSETYVRISIPDSPQPGNVANPWTDDPIWASEPDGEAIIIVNRPTPERASGASFAIIRIGINGDTLFHRGIDYLPTELTADHADPWFNSMAQRLGQLLSVTEAQAERAIRRAIQPPRYHIPVSRMVVGQDGTIWLRREDIGREAVDWQVFDRSGVVLGRVSLPSTFDMHRARTDRVWGVQKDSLDVPFLQVYEIVQPTIGARGDAKVAEADVR